MSTAKEMLPVHLKCLPAAGSGSGYLYSVDNGSFPTQDQYTGLTAGSYTVTAQDGHGCTKTSIVSITQPANALTLAVTSHKDIQCHGNATGLIKVSAAGGAKPYSNYTLSSPVNLSNTTGSFKTCRHGDYTISITDVRGCVADTSVTLTEPMSGCNNTIAADDGEGSMITQAKTGNLEAVISPNPAVNEFTLSVMSSSSNPVTVRIVDIVGKVLYNKQVPPINLIVSGNNLSTVFILSR